MNTYVNIQSNTMQDHFQVSLHFSESQLTLTRPQGFKRPITTTLRLADIKHLIIDESFGSPIISFFYQDRRYTFYETGPAVTEYLRDNLAA
ncbi:MAG: hypothetical protein RSC16_07930 [Enterococcus sp.]|uniref:hypothetical protein n=1 Tax=Enterococcus sp. TaxID=35783 RepID=UPI002FC71EC0